MKDGGPETIDEAVQIAKLSLCEEDRRQLADCEDLLAHHFGLGLHLRNRFELGAGDSLTREFLEAGVYHEDSMSMALMKAVRESIRPDYEIHKLMAENGVSEDTARRVLAARSGGCLRVKPDPTGIRNYSANYAELVRMKMERYCVDLDTASSMVQVDVTGGDCVAIDENGEDVFVMSADGSRPYYEESYWRDRAAQADML